MAKPHTLLAPRPESRPMTSPDLKKPPTSNGAPKSAVELMGWLWGDYLKPHLGLLGIAIIFMLIEGSMVGAVSYMMKPMFDLVFVAGNTTALGWVSLVFLGIFCVRGLSGMVQKVLLTRISQETAAKLRLDLLKRLMRQDTSFHQTHPPGFLIQRVQTDVASVNNIWRAIITGAGRDAISLIFLIGVAVNIDWVWTLVMLVGLPLLMLPIGVAQRYVRKKASQARDLGAALATRLDEVFHGIVPIKLNSLEEYQPDRFAAHTQTFVRAEVRSSLGTAFITAMIDIMAGIGFMGVLLYGGSEIIDGEKTVGEFMSFFTAIGLAFDPMRRIAAVSGIWQSAAAALERLKELMDAPILVQPPTDPVPAPKGLPEVRLENVSLSYGDAPVLRDLNLVAEAGKTTALVGASGAGKSTVFNLLTRSLFRGESGSAAVRRDPAREHPAGPHRCQRRRPEEGPRRGPCLGLPAQADQRAGNTGGAAWLCPVRRPAAACGHRARPAPRHACAAA